MSKYRARDYGRLDIGVGISGELPGHVVGAVNREAFLIQLHAHCPTPVVTGFPNLILSMGGQVLLSTDRGYTLVVALDSSLQEDLRSHPWVTHIGGVQVRIRMVRRTRVDAMGNPVPVVP